MIDLDRYILLFLKQKTEEMKKFKNYLETYKSSVGELSQNDWETLYVNWAVQQDNIVCKMPKIYLNED